MPGHGLFEAHELFFPAAGSLRGRKVCALRKMREGLPDECGGLQGIAKAEKRDGMYFML